jgi:uncharacterized protein YegJ (DUF2314 family)
MDDKRTFGPVCHGCAPRPLGLTKEKIDPLTLVGRHVKLGFDTGIPDGEGPTKEHLWVIVTAADGDDLKGEIVNIPVVVNYRQGHPIVFTLDEIEDIYQEGTS